MLLYDPTGAHPHAWSGVPGQLPVHPPIETLRDVLGHVVPVTGRIAAALRRHAEPLVPKDTTGAPLLGSVLALPITALASLHLQLGDDGLERMEDHP